MRTKQDWLQDPTTYATCIMAILTDTFGTAFIEWDPITVGAEIKRQFGIEPEQLLQDKIQAGSALITSNLFHLALEAFSAVCSALSFAPVVSETFLPPDLEDCLWGITEAQLLEGKDFKETPFSHSVSRYVGFLLAEQGISQPPPALHFAEYPEGEVSLLNEEITEEDPVMFKAFWDRQQDMKTGLETENTDKLAELFRQLTELPLRYGSKEGLSDLTQSLQQLQQADSREPVYPSAAQYSY